jgi:predicted PurR-regulated permease PerM
MSDPRTPGGSATEPLLTRRQVRLLGYAVLAGGLLWVLYRCRSVFPVFLLGFLLAYIFDPVLDWLQTRGSTRPRATLVVFGVLTIVALAAAAVLVPIIVSQVHSLVADYGAYKATLGDLASRVESWAARFDPSGQTLGTVREGWTRLGAYAVKLAPRVGGWVAGSVSSLFLLLVLPLITYYFMQEIDPLRARIRLLLPADYADGIVEISGEINRMLGRYIRGQATVCLLVGASTTAVLLIQTAAFGMRYALLLGLLAGVTCVVPFLGANVSALVAGVVGYVTAENPWLCAGLAVGSVVGVNQLFDNVITPRIVGKSIGLHPLTVMFALMAGGALSGILGMIIAVPAAASIKALLVHVFPQLQEGRPPKQTEGDARRAGGREATPKRRSEPGRRASARRSARGRPDKSAPGDH